MGRKMKHTEIGDIPIDWEIQTFEETFRVLSNNTLSRENLNNKGGAVRNIHYGDILIKFSEVLNCKEEDIPYLNDLSLLTSSTQLLQDGDIVIADTAEDETVGKVTEVQNLGTDKLVAGLHTIPCRVKKGSFAPGWLGYYMNSHIYHDQIIPFITGIKVSSISKSAIAETIILIPPIEEQQRIVETLSQIDSLISQEKMVSNKLKSIKAGCLSKMYPKNGENKPEIRFKEFTDDWEQRKLGDLMEITSVKRIHQSDWTNSGVRFLRARDIVALSKNEEVSEPLFISQEKYDEYSALSGKVKIGDLLVTGVGTIGVPMLINSEEPLYFKDGNIIWFKNEDRIDGRFFYHSFNGSYIQNYIKESAGIGTVGTYTIDSGKKTPIFLPTQKYEQQKIGAFFSHLDNLITLHQRKCDKYKSIKAGLIRKFFPME